MIDVAPAGIGDSLFRRLTRASAATTWPPTPPSPATTQRVAHVAEFDSAIDAFTVQHPIAEVIAWLEAAGVPVGRIYSIADIAADPQYQAREMIVQTANADGAPLKVPSIVPKLTATPGRRLHPASRLRERNAEVLGASGWPRRRRARDFA